MQGNAYENDGYFVSPAMLKVWPSYLDYTGTWALCEIIVMGHAKMTRFKRFDAISNALDCV